MNKLKIKGAHSPDMRIVSMGVFPIQRINSQVLGQDDVSNERTNVHLNGDARQIKKHTHITSTFLQLKKNKYTHH